MKKAILYYFTGTGNTGLCANYIKKYLNESDIQTDSFEVDYKNTEAPNPNDYDIIGMGYPIHAFNVPQVFNYFIKKLPKVDDKLLFFFKVSGEPFSFNNASSYHIYRKLKKKGYKLINEKHFLMPYNIIFKYPDNLQKQMYLYLEPLAHAYAIQISKEEDHHIKYHLPSKILSFLFRVEWVAPKVNALFFHSKKKKCTMCMKCVNSCPTNSLYIKKDKIKTHTSCALCMRCSLNCPNNAINMGILNLWVVNGGFHYKKLVENNEIHGDHVTYNTRGYFRKFRKYFLKQNEMLREYNIDIPVNYKKEDLLENMIK